jgi:cytochrome b subunit of formate dehydrogenase
VVERNGRRARWFHAFVAIAGLLLIATGWWLWAGGEGDPSPLARLLSVPDTTLHKAIGWIFAVGAAGGATIGWRATRSLMVGSLRFARRDLHWFARWPGSLTSREFAWHDEHFDPGQRVFNLCTIAGLITLTISGIGLVTVHGGPAFVVFLKLHVWATYAVTVLVAGHIVIASGVLPGYRGVWRSIHLGGRLNRTVAERIWPGWARRTLGLSEENKKQSDHVADSPRPRVGKLARWLSRM